MTTIYASSTIMSGEVVTFATEFDKDGFANGPFEVSASRNAVMVHRADCRTDDDCSTLKSAIDAACAAMQRLKQVGYGAESLYSKEPTEITP